MTRTFFSLDFDAMQGVKCAVWQATQAVHNAAVRQSQREKISCS
jgi:hypothetical protein